VATSTFWSLANGAMEDFKRRYEEFRAAVETVALAPLLVVLRELEELTVC
jgi:hypothetical protein